MGSLVMSEAFRLLQGKRVFITGHTGFKGSWLAQILVNLGCEVAGYSLPAAPGGHFDRLDLGKRIVHIEADVGDQAKLAQAIHSFAPEFVFHLAAQALVKKSYTDPVETFRTNLMGSVHLLEAIRQAPSVRSLVFITSDKCYENHEWIWGYRENDQLGGHDPYSASKAAAEIAFSAYSRSFFQANPQIGTASARAGNVIGGGDWSADRIVPDCVRAVTSGEKVVLRNPRATRPWQHVLEPLSGYLALGAALYQAPEKYTGAWNFGPSSRECRNVGEVAQRLVAGMGSAGAVTIDSDSVHQHEAQLLQLNCDKAHQLLGWYPRWNIDQTLDATAEWYRKILGGEDAKEITARQIAQYFSEIDILQST